MLLLVLRLLVFSVRFILDLISEICFLVVMLGSLYCEILLLLNVLGVVKLFR